MARAILIGIVSAIDRLVKLLETGEKRRAVIFTNFVQDIYDKFNVVATDYICLFEKLGRTASEATTAQEFDEAFHEFERDREKLESLRREVEVLADCYERSIGYDSIKELLESIKCFFADPGSTDSQSRNMRLRILEYIRRRDQIRVERSNVFLSPTSPFVSSTWSLGYPSLVAEPLKPYRDESAWQAQEMQDQSLAENRATCMREVVDIVEYSKEEWAKINKKYAEIKAELTLK